MKTFALLILVTLLGLFPLAAQPTDYPVLEAKAEALSGGFKHSNAFRNHFPSNPVAFDYRNPIILQISPMRPQWTPIIYCKAPSVYGHPARLQASAQVR